MFPLAPRLPIKPKIPYRQTHEFWRERAIARMWCDLPSKQKYDLFDPSRGISKVNYWSWLDTACMFLEDEVRNA